MPPTDRSKLKHLKILAALALLALVLSNIAWCLTYLSWRQRESSCIKDNAKALAVMLGLIASALRNQSEENLNLAYAAADHSLMIAQALHDLEGGRGWGALLSAVASLHDLIASIYQGKKVSSDKLVQVADTLEKLSRSLNNLDLRSIEEYSQELVALLTPLSA